MSKVGRKLTLKRKLGSGNFGEVYAATCTTSGRTVACKLERREVECPQLQNESKIYKKMQGKEGFPGAFWFGSDADHNILIIEKLGPSLEYLYNYCGRSFSDQTVLLIGEQLIARLEIFHDADFIHRDIKPENFLIGRKEKRNMIYLIDFGLSQCYRDPVSNRHHVWQKAKKLVGTVRYSSINSQHGYEQSRRDDMESIAYVLLYFSKGYLPWQGVITSDKGVKKSRILEIKENLSIAYLCDNANIVIKRLLQYSRTLRFEDRPNYTFLQGLFLEALDFEDYAGSSRCFDWVEKKNIMKHMSSMPLDPCFAR